MYKGEIPFDPYTGDALDYPNNYYEWEYDGKRHRSWSEIQQKFGKEAVSKSERITVPPDWRRNTPFEAVMELRSMSRGRSAANFTLRCDANKEYTMFMTDLMDLLQKHGMVKGKTERLTWCFCKRGQNYGVMLYNG